MTSKYADKESDKTGWANQILGFTKNSIIRLSFSAFSLIIQFCDTSWTNVGGVFIAKYISKVSLGSLYLLMYCLIIV